uniref:FGGY carbohydrate kinase domain-containing protein n=1 Tax=Cacopsylla melanoneura TaxID=428564 RepID=A0A8D9BVW3_9HEMI
MDYLLSVDVGTSSVRAALVSARGKVGPIAVSPIQVWSPQPHFYQQSSEDIWQSVCKVVRDVTKAVNPDQIKGVGVDATCSLVALDSKHEPLTISPNGETNQNVILWMDHRAVDEATFINNTGHSVLDNVGGKISPEMETPKLLWLKTQLTESCWNKAGLFFDLPDFLSWKLTGDETRSLCSLVCKWTYDAHKRCWNENFFEKIGLIDLKQNQWRAIGTNVKNPGQSIGNGVSSEVSQQLGLNPRTPVSVSMIDAHAGALALLATNAPGIAKDFESRLGMICGTSTCHMAMARTQVRVPGIWGPYYEVILANTYLLEGGQSSAGKLLEHIIDTHPATASIKIKLNTKELGPVVQYLNQVIETKHSTEMTAECHVWPDFHGNRSPLADPDMRGAVRET